MDERETEERTDGEETGNPDMELSGGDGPDNSRDWASVSVLDGLLLKMETQLVAEGFKASIGDFIRLIEYRKKIEGESVKEMYVAWAVSSEMENVSAQ